MIRTLILIIMFSTNAAQAKLTDGTTEASVVAPGCDPNNPDSVCARDKTPDIFTKNRSHTLRVVEAIEKGNQAVDLNSPTATN